MYPRFSNYLISFEGHRRNVCGKKTCPDLFTLLYPAETINGSKYESKEMGEPGKMYHVRNVIGREELNYKWANE